MYVHGLTPLGGALVSAGVPILGGRPTVAGGGSSYGPAFLLGGSTADFSQGLYNSLSTLLNAGGTRLSAGTPTRSSAYQEQRAKTLDLAASLIDVGNTRAGRAKAEELLDKNANDVGALHLIAHSYVAEQEYEQAERYYARAFALAPSSARLKGDLTNARALQKGNDEVLAEGRRKIQSPAQRTEGLRLLLHLSDRDPNNADIYLALADGYAAARQPMQVLGALQEAVKVAGDGQIDEVIQKAKKLVEQYPDVGMPHNILGRALQKAGWLHEAFTELKAATTIAPNNFGYTQDLAGAYVARAQGKLAAGDVISARGDLEAAQGLDPTNGGLSEGFARVAAYRAERAVITGRFTAALTELATASSKAPDNEQFKKKLASLYIRVGRNGYPI